MERAGLLAETKRRHGGLAGWSVCAVEGRDFGRYKAASNAMPRSRVVKSKLHLSGGVKFSVIGSPTAHIVGALTFRFGSGNGTGWPCLKITGLYFSGTLLCMTGLFLYR